MKSPLYKTRERIMYYGASKEIIRKAQALRRNMTKAEKIVWSRLRNKQINNSRFYRQHPIDIFIVDFYCHKHKLVIEIDGEIHNDPENKEYDISRTEELKRFDLKVIRFTNKEVFSDIDKVIEEIKKHL